MVCLYLSLFQLRKTTVWIFKVNFQKFCNVNNRAFSKKNNFACRIMFQDGGEITSITTVGRQLYIALYNERLNTSYIYNGVSTNPFRTSNLSTLAYGPGKVKDMLIYHHSRVYSGKPLQHIILFLVCTLYFICMQFRKINVVRLRSYPCFCSGMFVFFLHIEFEKIQ